MSDQVRISYMGSFVGTQEATDYRDEFFNFFGQDIKDGNLVMIEDRIKYLNNKWVVRIMAENAQLELDLDDNENS